MENKEQTFERTVREHKSTIYTVCYMFSKDADEGTIKNWAIQGGVVGGVVGSIIGVYAARKIYKKMQDTNDEVIRQIDEMTEGEE